MYYICKLSATYVDCFDQFLCIIILCNITSITLILVVLNILCNNYNAIHDSIHKYLFV